MRWLVKYKRSSRSFVIFLLIWFSIYKENVFRLVKCVPFSRLFILFVISYTYHDFINIFSHSDIFIKLKVGSSISSCQRAALYPVFLYSYFKTKTFSPLLIFYYLQNCSKYLVIIDSSYLSIFTSFSR